MTKQRLFNLEFSYIPMVTLGLVAGIGIMMDLTNGFDIFHISISSSLPSETFPEQFLQYPIDECCLSAEARKLSNLLF